MAQPAARGKRRRRGASGKTAETEGADAAPEEPVAEATVAEAEPEAKPAKARGRRKKVEAEPVVEPAVVAAEPEPEIVPVDAPKAVRPKASRRVEQAEDVPIEPKLSVSGAETGEPVAEEKPRKGGWWQKRGFF